MDTATIRDLFIEYLCEGKLVTLEAATLSEYNSTRTKLFATKTAQALEYDTAGFVGEENPFYNTALRISPWDIDRGSFTVQLIPAHMKRNSGGPKAYKILSIEDAPNEQGE